MQRGRPQQPIDDELVQLYAGEGPLPSKHCEHPCKWRCLACRPGIQHHQVQSSHSLHKHEGYWRYALMCRICCPEERKKAPSQHEIDAWQVLRSLGPETPEWRVEERVLGGNWAAADIYFPSFGGIMMVDGEHHFPLGTGQRLFGGDGHEQQVRDLIYNVIAVASGFQVIRLHYQHKELWPQAIGQWLSSCTSGQAPDLLWVPVWKYAADARMSVNWQHAP